MQRYVSEIIRDTFASLSQDDTDQNVFTDTCFDKETISPPIILLDKVWTRMDTSFSTGERRVQEHESLNKRTDTYVLKNWWQKSFAEKKYKRQYNLYAGKKSRVAGIISRRTNEKFDASAKVFLLV